MRKQSCSEPVCLWFRRPMDPGLPRRVSRIWVDRRCLPCPDKLCSLKAAEAPASPAASGKVISILLEGYSTMQPLTLPPILEEIRFSHDDLFGAGCLYTDERLKSCLKLSLPCNLTRQ